MAQTAVLDTPTSTAPRRIGPAAVPNEDGDPHKYIIAFAVVLAALMQVIDSSIVNVALPDMMEISARVSTRSRGFRPATSWRA